MENATKALEMAGSVLIGVLLLGCLLFAYTRMSELKDTEHKVEVSEQAKDFNQDYETCCPRPICFPVLWKASWFPSVPTSFWPFP